MKLYATHNSKLFTFEALNTKLKITYKTRKHHHLYTVAAFNSIWSYDFVYWNIKEDLKRISESFLFNLQWQILRNESGILNA